MSKLRLIQAGVGGFGRGWATNIVPASNDFELVAIVDVNQGALDRAGEAIGLPDERRFTDLAAALQSVPADALLTVTPPAVHLEHARLGLDAGLHVMTEKPLADSIEAAVEIVRLAEVASRQLVVSQNYRYHPAPLLLAELVAQRHVGGMGHVHIDFFIPADFRGTFREKMPHVLLVDMAIHHIDLLRYIAGQNVVEVFAQTFHPPWSWYEHNPGVHAVMTLEDGSRCSYTGDWSARGRNTSWNGDWRIQCAEGSIHWRHDEVSIARSSRGFRDDTSIEGKPLPGMELRGQHATLATFATAIRTDRPAPTSGRDNLQSFGVIMAAVRSAETGQIVKLSDVID